MRVLFVVEKTIDCLGLYPSNALSNLVASFRGEHEVFHYEGVSGENVENKIRHYSPDLVIFSGPCRAYYGYDFFKRICAAYQSAYVGWDYGPTPFWIPGANIILDVPGHKDSLWTPQDESIFYPETKDIDVCFVGTTDPTRYPHRLHAINYLRQNINVITVGGLENGRWVSIREYASVMRRSKISLNFSRGIFGGWQVKGRSFESTFSGCLLLDDSEVLGHYFITGEEFVKFTSNKDLLDKVIYYLDNEVDRERIASRGRERAVRDYNSEKWWNEVMDRSRIIKLL